MKIKILYIIDKLTFAGAQTHLVRLIRALKKKGHDCAVYCLCEGGDLAEELNKEGIEVRVLGSRRIYGWKAFVKLFALARYIKEERFDIVHTYLFSANIYGTVAAKMAKASVIITSRRDTGKLREGKGRHRIAYRLTNRFVDKVICVTKSVEEIVRLSENLSNEKTATVYNGIEMNESRLSSADQENLKKILGISARDKVVIFVANFSWIKGHASFIQAARNVIDKLSSVKFLLVGDGPLRADAERQAKELKIHDHVLFLGKRSDVSELFQIADISINNSYSEGMSNTLLESMSAGVPVVATDVDGNKEVVCGMDHEKPTGILVEPDNPSQLSQAKIRILTDQVLAGKMSHNALERVKSEFSIEKMAEETERVYGELLKKNTPHKDVGVCSN